jgi:hypothetical protein
MNMANGAWSRWWPLTHPNATGHNEDYWFSTVQGKILKDPNDKFIIGTGANNSKCVLLGVDFTNIGANYKNSSYQSNTLGGVDWNQTAYNIIIRSKLYSMGDVGKVKRFRYVRLKTQIEHAVSPALSFTVVTVFDVFHRYANPDNYNAGVGFPVLPGVKNLALNTVYIPSQSPNRRFRNLQLVVNGNPVNGIGGDTQRTYFMYEGAEIYFSPSGRSRLL